MSHITQLMVTMVKIWVDTIHTKKKKKKKNCGYYKMILKQITELLELVMNFTLTTSIGWVVSGDAGGKKQYLSALLC